jgi:hypothetical protein
VKNFGAVKILTIIKRRKNMPVCGMKLKIFVKNVLCAKIYGFGNKLPM